jgi:hypothetical protein
MRIQSFLAAASASVLVIGMGAIAGIAAHLSYSKADGEVPVAVAAKPLDRSCMDCGVVVGVRSIELGGRKPRGRQLEPAPASRRYQIQVRMSDGSVKTLTYGTAPAWKAGDRVRLQNGRLVG